MDTKFGLTHTEFRNLRQKKLKKLFDICYKKNITFATLFMTSHICYRIYNEQLFDDPKLDWDLVFLIAFWLSTKFIICNKYYTVWLVYDNLNKEYDIKDICAAEIAIIEALDYDLGHRKLWPDGVPEEDFDDYFF